MTFSIAVLTYNRRSVLEELLVLLMRLNYKLLEIIVVDNCSGDGTREMVEEQFPGIKYIRLTRNVGAAARNIGLQAATGDVVVTLDDDIIGINDSSLHKLKILFKTRPMLGAVNFKVIDYFSGDVCNWAHHRVIEDSHEMQFATYEITEGAVALRKQAVEEVGYYPEYFFLSHEGPDLALRLINVDYEVIFSNEIEVRHRHSNMGRPHWLNYYYDTRNQFWLAARNLPLCYAIVYLARGLSSMLIYSIRDGCFIFWLKAIRDGLRGLNKAFEDRDVLSSEAMSVIRNIDTHRPGLIYSIRTRFFQKGVRL
jgi:GT2 family glycosyltransferase